jgi:F-type H+-transporting ATPase subunit b
LKYLNRTSHSFANVTRVLLWVVLAAGVAAIPYRSLAQDAPESTPAAQTSSSSAEAGKTDAAKQESKESDSEDKNIYRYTGLVKAAAKAMNLPIETTARLFEIINFVILFLCVVIPLTRLMPKILRKRGETVRADIESARKETESANARLSAIEAKLSGLDAEIAEIRTRVEEESKQDEVRIKASIEEESARIVASAEQEISIAAAHASRELRNFSAELAVEQATKQLALTPEADQALIAQFVKGIMGGQN